MRVIPTPHRYSLHQPPRTTVEPQQAVQLAQKARSPRSRRGTEGQVPALAPRYRGPCSPGACWRTEGQVPARVLLAQKAMLPGRVLARGLALVVSGSAQASELSAAEPAPSWVQPLPGDPSASRALH
ncbi:hypothetical protein NDU88_001096 [Pleurodeles waltl]|uniref:Uncharacterized protein n=1 Tax=Pleurodeles waltl TaxID=8319 RepID=A0AAV7R628_PLEWA|nr:hypothetical protein NDU88_001096 [Pleurodeles waltl]